MTIHPELWTIRCWNFGKFKRSVHSQCSNKHLYAIRRWMRFLLKSSESSKIFKLKQNWSEQAVEHNVVRPTTLLCVFCKMCMKWTHRVDHVHLSVRMIQLENRWTDLNEIWYGRYATGDYPKMIFFNFLQSVMPT
jgi:hypothetical protein